MKSVYFALAFALLGTSIAFAQGAEPSAAPALNADQIYFKSVAQLRTLPEPPYIEYTLNIEGSVLRHSGATVTHMVVRTADGTVFSHVVSEDGHALAKGQEPDSILDSASGLGPDFLMVMQRNAGKPNQGSIFGLSLDAMPTPEPAPSGGGLESVGEVRAIYNSHYAVQLAGVEKDALSGQSSYHLLLKPRRDPMNNPVREMWIDTNTFNLQKITLGVMLNEGPFHAPVAGIATFSQHGAYWLADQVSFGGRTRFLLLSASMAFRGSFENVRFPATEPAWMFDRALYAQRTGHPPGASIAIGIH